MMSGGSILHCCLVTFWCLVAAFGRFFVQGFADQAQGFLDQAFFMIWGCLPAEKTHPQLGSIFELVGTCCLIVFWRPFGEAVCRIWGAKWFQNGRQLEVVFGVVFWVVGNGF